MSDTPLSERCRDAMRDPLMSWGVRSLHSEWSDEEAASDASRDALAAVPAGESEPIGVLLDQLAPLREEREALAAALRRVMSFGPRGHRRRPLADESLEVVRAANRDGESSYSEQCWDCNAGGDKPVDPFNHPNGDTWGDRAHQEWEARAEAAALVAALAAPTVTDGRAATDPGGGS